MKSQRGDSYDNNYVYGYIYEYTNDYALLLCSWLCPKAMPQGYAFKKKVSLYIAIEKYLNLVNMSIIKSKS